MSTAKEMVVDSGRYTSDGIVAVAPNRGARRLIIANNRSSRQSGLQKEDTRTVFVLDQGFVDDILIVGIQV